MAGPAISLGAGYVSELLSTRFLMLLRIQALVRNKGLFSFYQDGHQECFCIRKVRPLRLALKGLQGWITGQRKDQSPGTRSVIPVVQVDPVFEGLDGGAGSLVKWDYGMFL